MKVLRSTLKHKIKDLVPASYLVLFLRAILRILVVTVLTEDSHEENTTSWYK